MRAGWIIAAILLAGCAASMNWMKPGADAAATASAYQKCRAAADAAVETEAEINEDIFATRQTDWQRAQIAPVTTGTMQQEIRDRTQSIIAACMQAQGFTLPR